MLTACLLSHPSKVVPVQFLHSDLPLWFSPFHTLESGHCILITLEGHREQLQLLQGRRFSINTQNSFFH